MRRIFRDCLLAPSIGLAFLAFPRPDLRAQTRICEHVPVLSDSAVVSVLTVLPGDRLYSLFGHTIIRVRDPVSGLDCGFNFGTFDFPQTLFGGAEFIARFAYGQLDYALSVSAAPAGCFRMVLETGTSSDDRTDAGSHARPGAVPVRHAVGERATREPPVPV